MDQGLPNLIFIGLSATPWSRGLGKYYDDLIIAATTRELIDAGCLSDFTAFAPSEPDLSSVSTVAGDFKQDELGDAMEKAQITGDIVATWLERGHNRATVAFCVNRNHAKHVAEQFAGAGVDVEYLDGKLPARTARPCGRFRSGTTKILVSIGVLTTGFDATSAASLTPSRPSRASSSFRR